MGISVFVSHLCFNAEGVQFSYWGSLCLLNVVLNINYGANEVAM